MRTHPQRRERQGHVCASRLPPLRERRPHSRLPALAPRAARSRRGLLEPLPEARSLSQVPRPARKAARGRTGARGGAPRGLAGLGRARPLSPRRASPAPRRLPPKRLQQHPRRPLLAPPPPPSGAHPPPPRVASLLNLGLAFSRVYANVAAARAYAAAQGHDEAAPSPRRGRSLGALRGARGSNGSKGP